MICSDGYRVRKKDDSHTVDRCIALFEVQQLYTHHAVSPAREQHQNQLQAERAIFQQSAAAPAQQTGVPYREAHADQQDEHHR